MKEVLIGWKKLHDIYIGHIRRRSFSIFQPMSNEIIFSFLCFHQKYCTSQVLLMSKQNLFIKHDNFQDNFSAEVILS